MTWQARKFPRLPGALLGRAGLLYALAWAPTFGWAAGALPGTDELAPERDVAARMVAGISRYLDRENDRSIAGRAAFWPQASAEVVGGADRVGANRERLKHILGLVDARLPSSELEYFATVSQPAKISESDRFSAYAIRWAVLPGIFGEGLLLQPKGPVLARMVAVPDADQTPELISGLAEGLPPERQFARRLAENGCQVIVVTLADRTDTFTGSPMVNRAVNQPHREWIYRQAYVLGRHIIGYEIQKVLSAVDWFERQADGRKRPVGVIGWGEGGLIALYSAAVDTRIRAAVVSGYYGPREGLWREPIYRNVFGLLREFGDAEITQLILPRVLVVEHSRGPDVRGPPAPRAGRTGAAPGAIRTFEFNQVKSELERATRLAGLRASSIMFQHGPGGTLLEPVAGSTLAAALKALGADLPSLAHPSGALKPRAGMYASARQERLVREMERYTQRQLQLAAGVRDEFLWQKASPSTPAAWESAMGPYREKFWNNVIGRLPTATAALQPRARQFVERPTWTGYDVMVDVLPDVFARGYYLVPKDLKPGERRPVVVAQHGLNGTPDDVMQEDTSTRAYAAYKAFAVRLVERGFIVFAPQNPYRGDDDFRELQRKANPLGLTLFSFIVAQHDRILDWLSTRPEVDASRIGFYGLSYGGCTAVNVPAIVERYAASVCSGAFNEWIWKATTTDWRSSYMYTGEYEHFYFNEGLTFGHAERAALIAPRPFMVERGHADGVGLDEWVAFEYAKVNRLYAKLRISARTEIEYFDGPHTINGVGAMKFLHRHLGWPEPRSTPTQPRP